MVLVDHAGRFSVWSVSSGNKLIEGEGAAVFSKEALVCFREGRLVVVGLPSGLILRGFCRA